MNQPPDQPASPDVNLRLVWPQWQGGGTSSVRQLASEFPFDVARRGYAVGAAVLDAVLPPHDGPTVTAAVTMGDEGLELRDGVEAKAVILHQLARALEVIAQYDPARIATLGGECSVGVAPFSALADRYGDDLAVVWIDSHPDVGTGDSEYPGYHAMAVSALTGHGDRDVLGALPATTPRTASHWSGCTPGPTTTTRTSPGGASAHSALRTCGAPATRFWTGSPAPAALASPSTSTSTPSTATRSSWASAPSPMA